MSLEKIVRRASPVALSLLLAACGGGSAGNTSESVEPEAGAAVGEAEGTESSSSQTPASTVFGRVADGYIKGAIVCVDMNDNDSCDTDEPSTVTGDGGTYNLDIPDGAQEKSIVADIPAEAIDEDTGEAVGKPLVFIAPANKPEFLSPITTLIHQELRANPALDIDDAEQAVKSILGIDDEDISLFSDYVAEGKDTSGDGVKGEKFRYLHDTARVVASLMKDIETQVESAAVSNGVDVAGSEDTQRAIREIVRSEVRELLPEIARQVAELVRPDGTSEQAGTDAATVFNPDQLAENLRPVDAGDSVEERIDAVRDRVDVVQSDIRQLLTDGVYWMEFDCNYDDRSEESTLVDGEVMVDAYDDEVSENVDDSGVMDYPMPECNARYGHVQLNASGDSMVSNDYLYDGDTGGWVLEDAEDDFRMANYSLVDGEWILVQSGGPEGQVEFTEDGTAVIVNEEGRMQLKAVTQDVGGRKVINHFWQDDANPLWFSLVEPTDMFSAGSLAHKISVRQSSHPFILFNHQPQDDQSREFCAQFYDNCNVVNTVMDGQHYAVTTLDEIRESAFVGTKLVTHSTGFGMDGLMKLSAEVPADGTLPTSGSVHWMMGFDGNNQEPGELPPAGMNGVDPYSTYPAGNDGQDECFASTGPDGVVYPDPQPNVVPVDGYVPDPTSPVGSDGTEVAIDGQDPRDSFDFVTAEVDLDATDQFPEAPDSGIHEETDFPENFIDQSLKHRYDKVFMMPPWKGIYKTDNERYESYEQSLIIYEHLILAYKKINYSLVIVPEGSIASRADFILNSLKP